jgi:hypothetical protein
MSVEELIELEPRQMMEWIITGGVDQVPDSELQRRLREWPEIRSRLP